MPFGISLVPVTRVEQVDRAWHVAWKMPRKRSFLRLVRVDEDGGTDLACLDKRIDSAAQILADYVHTVGNAEVASTARAFAATCARRQLAHFAELLRTRRRVLEPLTPEEEGEEQARTHALERVRSYLDENWPTD
jgi:hypothetical protein